METICLKIDENVLKNVDKSIKNHNYSTRTEFIREAIRDKIIELEKHKITEKEMREMLKAVDRLHGISKRKTADKDVHKTKNTAFEELERAYRIK